MNRHRISPGKNDEPTLDFSRISRHRISRDTGFLGQTDTGFLRARMMNRHRISCSTPNFLLTPDFLLSTVCEGKKPRGHARKRLMQAAQGLRKCCSVMSLFHSPASSVTHIVSATVFVQFTFHPDHQRSQIEGSSRLMGTFAGAALASHSCSWGLASSCMRSSAPVTHERPALSKSTSSAAGARSCS